MQKQRLIIALIVFVVFLAQLACRSNLRTTKDDSDAQNELAELQEALKIDLIDHRPEVYAYLGRPDAFDIAVIEVEGVLVRMESWRYYQYGTQVDFVDGSAIWVVEIDPMPEGTIFAAWYDPMAFFDGITGTSAIQIATDASPDNMAPQIIDLAEGGEDLVGGYALVGDQIVIGLFQDQVVYVETIAFVPEGGLQ